MKNTSHKFGWENIEVLWELMVNENEINNKKFIMEVALKTAEVLRVQ
jgi:hypothetical protein